ncbi:MAG TPA: hypothetical protein VLD55_05935, partial [Candidatus Sulfobium mesophilum]|nr:hypothetical protein [Candidatus Sulfobium mesophilum]
MLRFDLTANLRSSPTYPYTYEQFSGNELSSFASYKRVCGVLATDTRFLLEINATGYMVKVGVLLLLTV